MNTRLKAFRFKYTDAWGLVDYGYDSILELSETNGSVIRFLVNNKAVKIKLRNKEEEFINDILFMNEWNDKTYLSDMPSEDGIHWYLEIAYDNILINCNGHNAYPKDFMKFLNILHDKYKLPKAVLDNCCTEYDIKHTVIKEGSDTVIW